MKVDLSKTQAIEDNVSIPKKLSTFIGIFLKRHPWSLVMFSIFVVFEACEASVSAYLLKVIIDGVMATENQLNAFMKTLLVPAILYASIPMILNIVFRANQYANLQFYPKNHVRYCGNHASLFITAFVSLFYRALFGQLIQKNIDLTGGVESLIQIFTDVLLPRTLAIVISSALLYRVHPIFLLDAMSWAIGYIAVSYWMSQKSEQLSYAVSEAGNNMSGKIVDSIINVMNTKLFANVKYEEKVVFSSIDNLMAKDRALQWYLVKAYFMQGIWITLLMSIMLSGLFYGRFQHWVTVGDFALILTLSLRLQCVFIIWDKKFSDFQSKRVPVDKR